MKRLEAETRDRIRGIALDSLKTQVEELRITPWVVALPPWNWIHRQPFLGGLIFSTLCYVFVIITNLGLLSLDFLLKTFWIFLEVVIGTSGVFLYSREFENIFEDLRRISLLPRDTLKRWFLFNIGPFWGNINLIPGSDRTNYGLKEVFRYDKVIIGQFIFWTIFNGTVAVAGTRVLWMDKSVGWFFLLLFCYLWAYSFMWTSHYGHAVLAFLFKLGGLPVRYSLFMPNSLTLKNVGDRMVNLGWISCFHFWTLICILNSWKLIDRRPGENQTTAAVITLFCVIAIVLYVSYQVLIVVVTQIALSKNMIQYRRRRIAEYYINLEVFSEEFTRRPSEGSFKELTEAAAYRKVFRSLPGISLSGWGLTNFIIQIVCNVAVVWWYLEYSVGGVGEIRDLLRPLLS